MDLDLIDRIAAFSPAGLLLLALLFQHRQNERQRAADAVRIKELETKLEAEHQARLQDLTDNQRTLLEIHDQTHKSLGVVDQVLARLDRRPR